MKKMQFAVVFALVFACAGQVFAGEMDVKGLLRAKGCYGCHSDSIGTIGPSFQAISRHYRGVSTAKETLVMVVLNGTSDGDGNYKWGTIRMPPPDRRVSMDRGEAEVLVNYILTLR